MTFPLATLPLRRRQSNTALLISPFEQDHRLLQSLFREQGWELHGTRSLESALTLLRRGVASLVITEKDLPVGNWKDVLDAVLQLPASPLVVVSSLHADDYLWAEALNLGAYDVLPKPIERMEAIRVFSSAWMRHRGPDLGPTRKAG
jgi:DNA-binding NtrC family response regulator